MLSFRERSDLAISFDSLKLICHNKSSVQDISLYSHPQLGKILVIDNEIQHVEAWAPLYHEMLVHLPAAFIPRINTVLILGGGSLYAAAEALKYKTVRNVLLIDHDSTVIGTVRKNYPHAKAVLKDKRFSMKINDAFEEIHQSEDKYDLIINDSIDLVNNDGGFSSKKLRFLASKLKLGGICCDVVYRNIFERKTTRETLKKLKKEFESTFSLVTVPDYPGIFHILCLWSNTNVRLSVHKVVNQDQKRWMTKRNSPCQFYDPRFLEFYLYLPSYLWRILGTQ